MGLFRRERVELCEFREVLRHLRSRLFNQELLDYITEKLFEAERERSFTYLSLEKVEAIDNKTGDTFSLEIKDDEIITYMTCWNNHHRERKIIKFADNIVAVRQEESTDVYASMTGLPASTARKAKVEVYVDDQLFCVKEMESTTESALSVLKSSTVVAETFINQDREAVRREICAADDDALFESGTEYTYSSRYDAPPFRNIGYEKTAFIYGMDPISEEAYKRFLEDLKETKDKVQEKVAPTM